MGPVVALIGLELAGSAASTAGLLDDKVDPKNVIVFLVTLGAAVFGQILSEISFRYSDPDRDHCRLCSSRSMRASDFTASVKAAFFALPNFTSPKFSS